MTYWLADGEQVGQKIGRDPAGGTPGRSPGNVIRHNLQGMWSFQILKLEHGWLDVRIADDTSEVTVTASYLSDAPRDLLLASAKVFEGAREAQCEWMEEPGEFRFRLSPRGGDLHLKIWWHDRLNDRLVFEGQGDLQSWGFEIARAFGQLLREYGEEGYRERWINYEFPMPDFNRLRRLVADH